MKFDQLRKAMMRESGKEDQEVRRESSPKITEEMNDENTNQY